MARVAVAGGTGGLGQRIVEAICTKQKHVIFLLSRANQIDTVISTIGILSEDAHVAQLNLIDGAARSGTVTRFAPSEFGWDYVEAENQGYPLLLPGMDTYKSSSYKVEAVKKLKETHLGFTRFIVGFLLDYYGHPRETVCVTPLAVVVDVEHGKAAIPGTGDDPVTLTHSLDIARFVTASLDFPDWPERSWIIGDTVTWNQMLRWAEEFCGQKFDIHHDSEVDLKNAVITELPGNDAALAVVPKPLLDAIRANWSIGFIKGHFNLPSQSASMETLNDKLPHMKPIEAKEFLRRCWGK
ncbi:NAD(P)-binding protein [Aspergillus welwitschiae]|uniref:NAD(P)-binding protein n=1 Tax=Aspergillus welwitschiae TaxID=1341132 RepID=A0A3F3PIJ4_9EURO|nr:NAD(P)-binding protein [Aspergillus welwitschiae]RDH26770.1 NAD(P)-binding protein [Aspergillus welwitschiae]